MVIIKNKCIVLISIFLICTNSIASRTSRDSPESLIKKAEIIVLGDVVKIHPSLIVNDLGHPVGIAEIKVKEIFKGTVPEIIFVPTDYSGPTYDKYGKFIRPTSIQTFPSSSGDKNILCFLNERDYEKSNAYMPVQGSSGLFNTQSYPKYLEKVVKVLANN